MRQETFRTELTMLKLRRYSSAPPPFSFKLGRLPPCNTITPLPNYSTNYSFRQLILIFLSSTLSLLYLKYSITEIPYKLCEIIFFGCYGWVLYGCYELELSWFILNIINAETPEPAQFQAISLFRYGGSVKYASVAPTTNFRKRQIR